MNQNQNNIIKSNEKMDAIRQEMNWNQQQLNDWLEKTKVVDDDAQLLEKYSRADEAKIKEISLQIERLVAEAAKAKKQLDNEITETHVNQVALEKVCSISNIFNWLRIDTGCREFPPHSPRATRAHQALGAKLA